MKNRTSEMKKETLCYLWMLI